MLLGPNVNSDLIKVKGGSPNPFRRSPPAGVIGLTAFMLVMVAVGVWCYVRWQRVDEKKRTVVFGSQVAASSSQVRRYKNGVEIKPSEYSANDRKKVQDNAKARSNINETVDLDAALISDEDSDGKDVPAMDADEEEKE